MHKFLMTFLAICFIWSHQLLAQRVTFKDPDLTFSFKKPKDWVVYDNGYIVKVFPPTHAKDTSTYFTITYFEAPVPSQNIVGADGVEVAIEQDPLDSSRFEIMSEKSSGTMKIAKAQATWQLYTHQQGETEKRTMIYQFKMYNQRFELETSSPKVQYKSFESAFRKIISSIRVRPN